MSISTRIQAIEQHLTDDYNVLEVAGADLTNVNKNILNLKTTWQERLLYFINNGTDVVWNNWDKVTGEGTILTLNNTEEAPMKINLKGNTSQEGTPTPEAPQDIHVVSGDNSIEVKGKNLFKNKATSQTINGVVFTVYDDGSVKAEGKATANTALPITGANNVFVDLGLQNGTYRLSGATGGAQNTWAIYMAIKHSDNTTYTLYNTNGDLAFTKETGDTFFSVIRIENGTTVNQMFYPMIRLSSVLDDTYEPYKGATYPVNLGTMELCKIGDYQDKIEKSSGKNSFNPQDFITAMSTNYREIKTINGVEFICLGRSQSTTTTYTYSLNCKENTQYALSFKYISSSCGLRVVYSDGTDSGSLTPDKTTLTDVSFTSVANKTITGISLYCGGWYASGNKLEITQIMLNEGSTALPYEPYGTGWYVKKEIGKVVLDGSETWVLNESGTGYVRFTTTESDLISTSASDVAKYFVISDKFVSSTSNQTVNANADKNRVCAVTNNRLLFKTLDTSLSTVQLWKTWLSTHNATIYYVLNTPTITEITDSTLISQLEALEKARSYNGQTNISQNNDDLPFIINATALKEMA